MKTIQNILVLALLFLSNIYVKAQENILTYKIVDTGVEMFYSNDSIISTPKSGEKYFGQDAQYLTNPPSYTDNKNGTITDNVTGLMWQKTMGEKLTYQEASQKVKNTNLGGYDDWRIPSIKELYSLIQFTGSIKGRGNIDPYIDTKYFNQPLGNTSLGEREIDAQTWSYTEYIGKTMRNDETIFGVNFVDGRIKGYPKYNPRERGNPNKMYFRFVRANKFYGENNFIDNKNGTISDSATGLMWQKSDSGRGMNWQDALKYAQNLNVGGYDDWHLPNAKELQSIVDYNRSPSVTNSASIDPIFQTTSIVNEKDEKDYPYFWSSTTHLDGPVPESGAVYVTFGKSLGKMHGRIMDVHGAGSQRSDPKTGSPTSRGPQGDMIRVKNYVRSVRGGAVTVITPENKNQYYDDVEVKQSFSPRTRRQQNFEDDFGSRPTRGGFLKRLDKNNDGKVSKSEFDGPKNRFNYHDKNNDGYLTEGEFPQGPPPGNNRMLRF